MTNCQHCSRESPLISQAPGLCADCALTEKINWWGLLPRKAMSEDENERLVKEMMKFLRGKRG